MIQHFRVARPTNNLGPILRFYREGLGFQLIASFQNHKGFDGLMLGHPDLPWHLEFTREDGLEAPTSPTNEHLLVLYFEPKAAWEEAVSRLRNFGLEPVTPHNPYWEAKSLTFADPDGYRVILFDGPWRSNS